MMEREPIEDHRHVSLGDTQEPWDDADSLPLTDEELAGLRPLREANPGLVDSLRLMRESMEATMEVVSLKLDKDVMAALRSEGPGLGATRQRRVAGEHWASEPPQHHRRQHGRDHGVEPHGDARESSCHVVDREGSRGADAVGREAGREAARRIVADAEPRSSAVSPSRLR